MKWASQFIASFAREARRYDLWVPFPLLLLTRLRVQRRVEVGSRLTSSMFDTFNKGSDWKLRRERSNKY